MSFALSGISGAGNGSRTRDLNLGKVALYQLSYSRKIEFAIVIADRWLSTINLGQGWNKLAWDH